MANCAQQACEVLRGADQACLWKHSDSVPGWTTFQSLGTLTFFGLVVEMQLLR